MWTKIFGPMTEMTNEQCTLPHRKSYYWEGCCLIENLTSCRAPKHEKTRDGMMSILSSGIPFKSSILNEATVPQIVRFFREAIRVIGHLSFLSLRSARDSVVRFG